jgi:hypothetical protein
MREDDMGLFGRKDQPADPVIDLTQAKAAPALEFGYPTPCPECGGPGYLDHIDPYKRVMYEHCPACFTRYEVTEEQLA